MMVITVIVIFGINQVLADCLMNGPLTPCPNGDQTCENVCANAISAAASIINHSTLTMNCEDCCASYCNKSRPPTDSNPW